MLTTALREGCILPSEHSVHNESFACLHVLDHDCQRDNSLHAGDRPQRISDKRLLRATSRHTVQQKAVPPRVIQRRAQPALAVPTSRAGCALSKAAAHVSGHEPRGITVSFDQCQRMSLTPFVLCHSRGTGDGGAACQGQTQGHSVRHRRHPREQRPPTLPGVSQNASY